MARPSANFWNDGVAPALHPGMNTRETAIMDYAEELVDDEAGARASAITAHEADTTAVHGISNTANLVLTGDSRLSDARTPTDGSVTAAKVADALKPSVAASAGTEALRALGTTSSTAAAGNDSRLSDTRTPTNATVTAAKVAATLKPTGSAVAGDEALRALGTSSSTACAGDDSRLSDSRAPTGAAGGVLSGTYPNPGFAADMATQSELDAHTSDTTAVHGIGNTSFVPQYLVEIDPTGYPARPAGLADGLARFIGWSNPGPAGSDVMEPLDEWVVIPEPE